MTKCPICDQEPRGRNRTYDYFHCANGHSTVVVYYAASAASFSIGRFEITGNREFCHIREYARPSKCIDVDIRDIVNLSAKALEFLWEKGCWDKIKTVSLMI